MNSWQLLRRGLAYYSRAHCAVILGVAVATAVLTGALLVGDSMRESLRRLVLEKLGPIDRVLVVDRFFRSELASELNAAPGFAERFAADAAILVEGSLAAPQSGRRASHAIVLSSTTNFFQGWQGAETLADLQPGQVALGPALADDLGVAAGDEVILRLAEPSGVPADSPLGRKTDRLRSRRLRVATVLPEHGISAFALRPSQLESRTAFVLPETLEKMLDQPGRANAIFLRRRQGVPRSRDDDSFLARALRPTLDDFGLTLALLPAGYSQLTSRRMLLDPAVEEAALRNVELSPQPTLTYLANTIAVGERSIPYSTVTGLDFRMEPPLGPWRDREGQPLAPLADDELVLNSWAAEQLGAAPGNTVRIDYFEPESTHGQTRETSATFRLRAIVPLEGPAAARDLTPDVPGITDQKAIADWNPPFPFDAKRIRDVDEAYWDEHRATPKAFVSLATAERLWGSRFGRATAVRFSSPAGLSPDEIGTRLLPEPESLGFTFQNVRQQGLAAASGTTPFDALFLGFSFFLIAAALLLVTTLLRLSLDQRERETGLLSALGFSTRALVRLYLGEGLLLALAGSLLGALGGIGYAALLVRGLRTWWVDAISIPFVELSVRPLSLGLGILLGAGAALATVAWSVWRYDFRAAGARLAGRSELMSLARARSSGFSWIAWGFLLLAALLAATGRQLGGPAQAGAFFGSGAAVLVGLFLLVRSRLRESRPRPLVGQSGSRQGALLQFAVRNAARHPGRSAATMGLIASASFLIVAISAFRLSPEVETADRRGGAGGFSLVGQSAQPIYQNWDTPEGREELGIGAGAAARLADSRSFAFRLVGGDDASCLNLFQARQPRILGVPRALVERGGFSWAQSAAGTETERENPWRLLEREIAPAEEAGGRSIPRIPAVLDQNTAMYSLHLWRGVGEHFDVVDGRGQTLRLVVVGLLQNSVLQGELIIGEQAVERYFPDVSGYRYFLIETSPGAAADVQTSLEESLGDWGLDLSSTAARLHSLMAVQNTYLSTFQSLGGLGLLLGTLGLAAVQLRNVLERRHELALLAATGFRRRRLAALVVLETGYLLMAGLMMGLVAALVALQPHWGNRASELPWTATLTTLALVVAVGLCVGLIAARRALAGNVREALAGG